MHKGLNIGVGVIERRDRHKYGLAIGAVIVGVFAIMDEGMRPTAGQLIIVDYSHANHHT